MMNKLETRLISFITFGITISSEVLHFDFGLLWNLNLARLKQVIIFVISQIKVPRRTLRVRGK